MQRVLFFLSGIICLVGTACGSNQKKDLPYRRHDISLNELVSSFQVEVQDTPLTKKVALAEVAVVGVRGIQHVGLSNLKPEFSYRGITGDRMAVYVPHPSSSISYMVEAVTVALRVPKHSPSFEQGVLRVQLCKAADVNHPPGEPLLAQDLIISPRDQKKARNGVIVLSLPQSIELPDAGLYVVAAWEYERTGQDVTSREIRSAALAANLSLTDSYTWNGAGDLRQTWRREGEPNSMSTAIPSLKGKIFNAMMGVKVKEKE